MINDLSIGGEENTLLSDSETRFKISIAFYLSILSSRYKGFSDETEKEKILSKLVRWLFINSEGNSSNKSTHLSQFQTIESAAWRILEI